MFLSSNKIIKSIIKIKAQNFDNKNKKQKIKQKHDAQKIIYYILSYLAFIKVMFLLLNTKLYSFIDKKKLWRISTNCYHQIYNLYFNLVNAKLKQKDQKKTKKIRSMFAMNCYLIIVQVFYKSGLFYYCKKYGNSY